MIANLQKATWTDLQALATLANAKLAPAIPYSFPAFAGPDKIALPKDLAPGAVYGAGGFFNPGSKVTFRLYGYRTIAGVKYYSFQPLRQAFVGATGAGSFSMTWTWTNPILNAPDGYIVAIVLPVSGGAGWEWAWQDIGLATTFFEDGSFSAGWKIDFSLDAYNDGFPDQNLPCGHGAWLKQLNRIRNEFFAGMDLFGGSSISVNDSFLLSGPWCVSVAPKCYLKLAGKSVYKNLRFIYSPADSATGNQLAPEADMFGTYIGVNNGANNFNWDVNAVVNGRIMIFSGEGEVFADWTVAASHPGIVISFDAHYFDSAFGGRVVSAFIFDLTNVQYLVGTPIVLTCTPPAGHGVLNPGDPAGDGGRVDAVFTGDAVTYAQVDTIAIHPGSGAIAPATAKAVALDASLAPITLTTPAGGTNAQESHHRSFCDGVFTANTLPTPGVMSYLDIDLPQYSPAESFLPASSRRAPRDPDLPFMPTFGNKAALYPVYRDTEFTPDNVAGRPINGSFAYQRQGTKYAAPFVNTDSISPGGAANHLHYYPLFVEAGAADVRFIAQDPNVTLYVRANDFPTVAVFDASVPGNTWLSLKDTLPGFETNTTWFIGVLNPTAGPLTVTTAIITIQDDAAPTGTFFPTTRGFDGTTAPQLEGFSYHFSDNAHDLRPIPQFGYCVSQLTVRRQPVANRAGIKISPSAGTADLPVKIGLMKGFSFDAAGLFTEMLTITIPAGQASVTVPVFWPVLGGTPLAYQCAESVIVLAAVNFQPMMYSTFNPATVTVDGTPQPAGYYGGPVWFSQDAALLFFENNDPVTPIVLPPHAAVYNDLEAALNLL
jgi:hypothetical protein